MTELETHVSSLIEKAEKGTHTERMRLQPQIDSVVTTMTLQGLNVPYKLRAINNTLKDEALDDMFDNMPI